MPGPGTCWTGPGWVIATPPLPAEAAAFLRAYAPGCRPIDYDALERDEPRN
ncbi:hypothetical protein QFZ75_004565 [Streptomyces sp. V3I8]|uniref:hypothetical protein n=1 Tax=Streptomyces sp. V3I8 TaxID=3042279 RepID=UPI002785CF76|nr:hypothetical protein [Streptomyces sp. V3I8]MDQ1038149.1 hypothetical protein [Streptomyces sp. V3I8]